jgi:hypothetical protein
VRVLLIQLQELLLRMQQAAMQVAEPPLQRILEVVEMVEQIKMAAQA